MYRIVAALCLGVAACLPVSAQQTAISPASPEQTVPRLIRFSGALKDNSGKPMAGTVGVTFTLYKDQTSNAALWIENQNVRLDADGKYSVLLGATKSAGIPVELFASGEAQWLGVHIQGQPEQPRVLMVSVPYALRAAQADSLAGHAATDFVTTDKLTSAVQQQLQDSRFNTASSKSNKLNGIIIDPATTFSDTNTSQIVSVIQSGTGQGLVATAKSNTAITGTSNASTGATIGVLGQSASTSGIGIRGFVSAATGGTIGLFGSAASTSGTAIAATESATSGNTIGLQAAVSSSSGTSAVLKNKASGMLLSGQSGASNTQVFSFDGSGNLNSSGYLNATGIVESSSYMYAPWGWFNYGDGVALYTYNKSTTSTNPTIYAINYDVTSPSDLVFETLGNNYGGQCTIDVSGNLFCTGTLGPALATPTGGKIGMYSMQTPENWIEDFGSAKLVNGVAKISIESRLKDLVSGSSEYHVYVTPAEDCEGLFVTNRTATSFEVHELRGGKSSVAFDYRVVVHRKGYETSRMPDLSERFGNAEAKKPKAPAGVAQVAPIAGHAD